MSRKLKEIKSAIEFEKGYFDPEKGSIHALEKTIKALSKSSEKTTDIEDKVLYAEQIQKLIKEYRDKTGAPTPRPPQHGTPTLKRHGRKYTASTKFGGKRRTRRRTKKPKNI